MQLILAGIDRRRCRSLDDQDAGATIEAHAVNARPAWEASHAVAVNELHKQEPKAA